MQQALFVMNNIQEKKLYNINNLQSLTLSRLN